MKHALQPYITKASDYLRRLKDVRVLGLHVFIGITILVTWNSIGVIQTNYELQQNLSRIEQENQIRQLENETIRLRNQYYETDQYLELAARKQFNKAAPGETVILVPPEVALENSVEPLPTNEAQQSTSIKPNYQQNFEAWMEFFFRRNANS